MGSIRQEDAEEEKKQKEEDELENEQEEVEEATNEGEMLIPRRVRSNKRGVKDEQCENIFCSCCTIEGRVWSLIIDGGSCAKVVLLSMIEKLGLQAMAYPHPYNIQWLNHSKRL